VFKLIGCWILFALVVEPVFERLLILNRGDGAEDVILLLFVIYKLLLLLLNEGRGLAVADAPIR
jgi:hypothetical protein